MHEPQIFRTLLAKRVYWSLVALAFGFGSAVLLGQADRFSGPGWTAPRKVGALLPGFGEEDAWISFGGAFVLYGLALVLVRALRQNRVERMVWALRAGVIVYGGLAVTFIFSLNLSPLAAGTGVPAYVTFAVLHGFLADDVKHPEGTFL